jgi:hypothetical protein
MSYFEILKPVNLYKLIIGKDHVFSEKGDYYLFFSMAKQLKIEKFTEDCF